MKKIVTRIVLGLLLVVGVSTASSAQVIVRVRPAAPVVVRPVAPSPRHVWVEGEWVVRHGHYEYVNGYWVTPRRGMHWVPGYWVPRRGGYIWISGHWAR